MAGTYVTHADFEKLLDMTLSASTTPTDTLIDNLTEQAEGLASVYLKEQGYTLANADSNNTAGLKAVLLQIVQWLLDEWHRRKQAGGAMSVSDESGSLTFRARYSLPNEFKPMLKALVLPKPEVALLDLVSDSTLD